MMAMTKQNCDNIYIYIYIYNMFLFIILVFVIYHLRPLKNLAVVCMDDIFQEE